MRSKTRRLHQLRKTLMKDCLQLGQKKKIVFGLHLATSYATKPQEIYSYILLLYLKLVLMFEEIITCITRLSCQTFSGGLQASNNDMETLLIMRIQPLAQACSQLALITYPISISLHSEMWLFTSCPFCMSNSLCVSLASPPFLLPEFHSLPRKPAYPLLPSYWLFRFLLNQSGVLGR